MHLDLEGDSRPAPKAYLPRVSEGLVGRLGGAGRPVRSDEDNPGARRGCTGDSFGNLIELAATGS